MYSLLVLYSEIAVPREIVVVEQAAEVRGRVADLLARHAGCERVVVMAAGQRLFQVDRAGNPIEA